MAWSGVAGLNEVGLPDGRLSCPFEEHPVTPVAAVSRASGITRGDRFISVT
jgi:hypothetical protein